MFCEITLSFLKWCCVLSNVLVFFKHCCFLTLDATVQRQTRIYEHSLEILPDNVCFFICTTKEKNNYLKQSILFHTRQRRHRLSLLRDIARTK